MIGRDLSFNGIGPFILEFSEDTGNNWTEISTLNCQSLIALSWTNGISEGILIGIIDFGVLLYSDVGDSLGSWNEGLSCGVIALGSDNNGNVYLGELTSMVLWCGEIWRRPLSEITPVEKNKIEIPSSYNLSQNFPNPFNLNTVICYHLPISGEVTIEVYDILGNEVAKLIDEYKPAGRYEVELNAATSPSGVYFYQLRAGSFVETKKMILMK